MYRIARWCALFVWVRRRSLRYRHSLLTVCRKVGAGAEGEVMSVQGVREALRLVRLALAEEGGKERGVVGGGGAQEGGGRGKVLEVKRGGMVAEVWWICGVSLRGQAAREPHEQLQQLQQRRNGSSSV